MGEKTEEPLMREEGTRQRGFGWKLAGLLLRPRTLILILIVAVLCGGSLGLGQYMGSRNKITNLGFENIGELATQSAYCTEVNVTEAAREFYGITIPFTQSKYIYSYDVVIKAGFDFREVKWKVEGKTIKVTLPEVKILSSQLDLDSFQLYHEAESIFMQISLQDNNEAIKAMVTDAQEQAVANGLLEEARKNGELILQGFFANVYDLSEYTIEFIEQK